MNTSGLIDKYVSLNPNYRNDLINLIIDDLLNKYVPSNYQDNLDDLIDDIDIEHTLLMVAIGIVITEFGIDQVEKIDKNGLINDMKNLIIQPDDSDSDNDDQDNDQNDDDIDIINITI